MSHDFAAAHSTRPFLAGCTSLILSLQFAACESAASAGAFDLDALPRLAATAGTRIGDVDDPDIGFSRVYGLDVDRDGQLYVFEGVDMQIRVYSPDGRLLRRIGGRGAGPGEFENAPRFGVVGDTIWAYDGFARRITLFRRDGSLLSASGRTSEITIPLPSCYGYVTPWSMRPDGLFSSDFGRVACSRTDPETSVREGDSIPVPRVVFDATGAIVDTIGWEASPPPRMVPPPGASPARFQSIEVAGRRLMVPDPPTTLAYWIPLDDGRLIVDTPLPVDAGSGSLTVTRLDLDRDTVYNHRFHYQPARYTDAELDAVAARASRGGFGMEPAGAGGGTPPPADPAAQRALREAMTFPEFKLPIGFVLVDADQRLWLSRAVPDGAPPRWIILGTDGMALGEVELPARSRYLWSSGSSFWALEPDDLDVPWLVQYLVD